MSKRAIRTSCRQLLKLLEKYTDKYGDMPRFDFEMDRCEWLMSRLQDFISDMGWQDPSRTFTPAERQLSVRLDSQPVLA